jgi:serine/threonine protein phosphatase PrpC
VFAAVRHRLWANTFRCADHLFLAVLDGHGGKMAAELGAKWLVDAILEKSKSYLDLDHTARSTPEGVAELKKGLSAAHLALDEKILSTFKAKFGEDVGNALKEAYVDGFCKVPAEKLRMDGRHSGTTCAVTVMTPSHFVFSSIGDCRIVLARDGMVDNTFKDHKPYDDIEKERIEKAGGVVKNKRIDGQLAVSRALGDFYMKTNKDLGPNEQKVSVEPETKVRIRTLGEEFLVMACDGVWDVLEPEEVANFIHKELEKDWWKKKKTQLWDLQPVLKRAVEGLTDLCLEKGSRDNVSCIVMVLNDVALQTRWNNDHKNYSYPRSARWILHWTKEAVVHWLLEDHDKVKGAYASIFGTCAVVYFLPPPPPYFFSLFFQPQHWHWHLKSTK